MCRKNLDLIKGRVLVQTSPSDAYNTEATVAHARRYDREFRRLNIPRDRFCIKILATGPGLNAARTLQQEGIATLGTAVFSVEQAIACSQAGCLFISPYYNGTQYMSKLIGKDCPSFLPLMKLIVF
jgi:transaldolase